MHALVNGGLRERPHARREIIGGPYRGAVLIVVAVTVAFGLSVNKDRFRKLGAIDAALESDLESIEALANAGACAQRRINGKVRQIRLNVRAAGLVGAQDEAPLEIDMGEAGYVDAAVDPAVSGGAIELVRGIEGGEGAAQIDRELVARPVGIGRQFGSVEVNPRTGDRWEAEPRGIGIVAPRVFEGRPKVERADLYPEGIEGLWLGKGPPERRRRRNSRGLDVGAGRRCARPELAQAAGKRPDRRLQEPG